MNRADMTKTGEPPFSRVSTTATGLLVIGTEHNCGKTVLITGLAAALKNQGFSVQAIKPVFMGAKKKADAELSFMSSIAQTPANYPHQHLDKPGRLNSPSWQQAILLSRQKAELTLIELPGSPATPVSIDDENSIFWKDTAQLAMEFNLPCLIVGKHTDDALEKLILACTYLKAQGLDIIALATVETEPGQGASFERMTRAEVELALSARTSVQYAGCIKYSPSISVQNGNQGNLIKMTEAGIDLLVLIKELNLNVPV